MIRAVYRVYITEYGRGWGQRTDGHRDFYSKSKAELFVDDYNKDLGKSPVPDVYWKASKPILIDLDNQ